MRENVKISIIGVSKRFNKFYLPLIKHLLKRENISIGYIYNRNFSKAKKIEKELGCGIAIQNFQDIKLCKDDSSIDLGIISLPSNINFRFNLRLINLGFNLFIETPISEKLWQADILEQKAINKDLFIGIGEDYCFSPEILLIKAYCKKRNIPSIIRNTGKSISYHSFALFTTLYNNKKIPNLKSYRNYSTSSNNLKINTDIFTFTDMRKYILESYNPHNYVARNIGELQLFFKKLTLTERNFIFQNSNLINNTIYQDYINDQYYYKSNLINNWKCKQYHQIESDFPMEKSKTNGLYFNFLNFLNAIEKNNKNKIPYDIKNAKFDLYLSKIQYLNRRLRITNIIVMNLIIKFFKILRKI